MFAAQNPGIMHGGVALPCLGSFSAGLHAHRPSMRGHNALLAWGHQRGRLGGHDAARVGSLRGGGDWSTEWIPPALLKLPFGTRGLLMINLIVYIGGSPLLNLAPLLPFFPPPST